MSHKTRTISWMEGKIVEILSKQGISYLPLSSIVFRNIDEEHNLDIALINLLSKRQIIKNNNDGITIYKLSA